jgi:murein DD-endopeptidase MepM/ murein hydrolase activator NlpD
MKIFEITAPKLDVNNPVAFIRDMQKSLGISDSDAGIGTDTPSISKPLDKQQDKPYTGSGLDPSKPSGIGINPNKTGGVGLKAPVNAPITSKFGYRTSVGSAHQHNGTDFGTPVGTPVKAPEGGVIKQASNDGGSAGTFIVLDAGGTVHKFFHLSKLMVSPGDKVEPGQTIGLTGNTGRSTGPHLHWEKHVAGKPVDPMSNMA